MGQGPTYTTSGARYSFLTAFARRTALLTLRPNLELYQWGSEAVVPMNEGKTIFAPYFVDNGIRDAAGVIAENATLATSGLSAHFYSGTLEEIDKAVEFGRFFWVTHSLRTVLEQATMDLTEAIAKGFESRIQSQISAATNLFGMGPDGLSAVNVRSGELATARVLFKARKKFAKQFVPGYRQLGGDYVMVADPDFTFNIFTNLSATTVWGATPINPQMDSMGLGGYRTHEIGRLATFRVMESAQSAKALAAGNLGLSAAVTGTLNYFLAPEAYFVSPLAGFPPSIIIHGFGSGGTSDPANRKMTVAGVLTAGTFAADTANRLMTLQLPDQE